MVLKRHKHEKIAQYHLSRNECECIIVMNMMFHFMELIPNASPYTRNEADVRRYLYDLTDIRYWCRSEAIQFASAEKVYGECRHQAYPDSLR